MKQNALTTNAQFEITYSTQQDCANGLNQLWHGLNRDMWAIGEHAAFMQERWGSLRQYSEANNVPYTLLLNACKVWSRYPRQKRVDGLSFAHHAAALQLEFKDASKLLNEADKEDWKVSDLRAKIREEQKETKEESPRAHKLVVPSALVSKLVEWLKERAQDYWTTETKSYWKRTLQPLVDLHSLL